MGLSASGSASAGAGAGASSSGKGSVGKGGGASASGSASAGAGAGGSSSGKGSVGGGGASASGSASAGAGAGGSSSGKGSSSGGSGGNSNANGGGSGFGGSNSPAGKSNSSLGGAGGGLNSAGNRASGAGPGASSNTSTIGGGYGSPSIGGMNSPRGMSNSSLGSGPTSTVSGQNSPAGMNNSTLSGGMASFNASQDKTRQADLAQQARTSEIQSMRDMSDWGKEVKSVVAAGPGWTTVALNNGLVETRKGDRASRNNNPGNIEAGAFAKKAGAIGTDGRFSVFASKEDGYKAISSLLSTDRYANKTVEGAIGSYAPPNENNTASYAATVAGKIGVSKDTPMSSLTAAQRDAMARAITGVEGNTGYSVSKTVGTDRFSSTYMGGVSKSTTATSAPSSAQKSGTSQNDPSGLPSGTYQGHVVGDGIAPSFAGPKAAAPSAPVASTPAPAPTPAAPTPAPERPRSLTEKVAAGAIDAGLGMLPGLGTAVSVINGGLALTGNKTLGERIAGSIATGEGAGTGPDSGANRTGGGNGGGQIVKTKTTVPKSDESFEDRYIAFVDPTKRPTPAQKWDYSTPGYA